LFNSKKFKKSGKVQKKFKKKVKKKHKKSSKSQENYGQKKAKENNEKFV